MAQAKVAKGLAEIALTISPEQMTLILAAAVPPTIQLALPTGSISPLSTPPPPPEITTTQSSRRDLIIYCKTRILPEEKTSRADIASMFLMTTNQLTKAVTGVDYESGPYSYKRKKMTTSATSLKAAKTDVATTPTTSTAQETVPEKEEDTLSSSSSSDLLLAF